MEGNQMRKSFLVASLLSAAGFATMSGHANAASCTLSNTAAPAISPASPVVGTAEKVTAGKYSGGAPTITEQWAYADTGANISGATGTAYTPVSGDVGHTLEVKETATIPCAQGATSVATAAVASGAGGGGVPSNTFTITSPANNATETQSFVVSGTAGSNWADSADFDLNWNKVCNDVVPSNSAYALTCNPSSLPSGSNTLTISAFNASTNPPGQPWAGTENDLNLAINWQPSSGGGGGGGSSGTPQPKGPSGNWSLVFDDEFANDSSLDLSKWACQDSATSNNVTYKCSNVAISGGNLVLTQTGSDSGTKYGGGVCSNNNGPSGDCTTTTPNGHALAVGEFAEASVYFPGTGGVAYNWDAWWVSGPTWPAGGEHDIAETAQGGGTQNCISYHNNSGDHEEGCPPGDWTNQFHTYGIYRQAPPAQTQVYYDGRLVASYLTNDTGQAEELLISTGYPTTVIGPTAFGASSQVKVQYVRVWKAQ